MSKNVRIYHSIGCRVDFDGQGGGVGVPMPAFGRLEALVVTTTRKAGLGKGKLYY